MRTTQSAAYRRWPAVVAILAGTTLIAMAVLAGCSSSGPSNSSSSAAEGSAFGVGASAPAVASPSAANEAGANRANGGNAAGGSAQSKSAARLAPSAQQLIYTAQLTVRAKSVGTAVSQATTIAIGAGGYVSNENASSDPDHPDQAIATIELKIPVGMYAPTLSKLSAGLGTQLSLRQQAKDVTEQVADVNSRVASDEAAIAQLRALLRHAGSVADLLTVQEQINSEESDLESLQSEQSALNRETSYATVTVTIVGPKAPKAVAKPQKPKAPPGFTSGISGGWRAFRTAVSWFLAIIGAVAPFAAAVAVLGYLAYWIRRRVTRRGQTPTGA